MPRVFRAPWLLLALLCWYDGGQDAAADPPPQQPSQLPPPASCLDRSIADEMSESLTRRGVQKKTFLKKGRFQLIGEGGLYASDLLSTSYMYGGAVAFWATEDLAFEVMIDATPIALELDEPVADFFGDPRFERGTGVLALAGLLWSPIHFKVKSTGGSILHGDVALALGVGQMVHETTQGLAFDGGLVVDLYLWKYVSVRFDVRDVVLIQEAVAETRITNNISAILGVGFWLPAVY